MFSSINHPFWWFSPYFWFNTQINHELNMKPPTLPPVTRVTPPTSPLFSDGFSIGERVVKVEKGVCQTEYSPKNRAKTLPETNSKFAPENGWLED